MSGEEPTGTGSGISGGGVVSAGGSVGIPSSFAPEGGSGVRSVDIDGPYDPGDLTIIDRAIRHMPQVVEYCVKKAQQGLQMTGAPEEFAVVLQNQGNTSRPRAYMAPNTSDGIHLELSEGVLLKAAVSMEGQ